ncbi:hypothetical protein ACPA9J_03485 [Pseudomonas aeruginosa]
MVLGIAGLLMLARHGSEMWLYVGVSFTAAGTGLVLPTLAYLAAGTSARRLGIAMGGARRGNSASDKHWDRPPPDGYSAL